MKTTYRDHFAGKDKGTRYDQDQYSPSSYSTLLWELEKDLLRKEFTLLRSTHKTINYLDFATGTGRIISFAEPYTDHATGIEISQDMVDIAEKRTQNAKLLRKDITKPDSDVEDHYDLITTFRFLLNAEPALQLSGMRALAQRLRDGSSVLIFNNHGNFYSPKIILWPIHKIKQLGKNYLPKGNYLTHRKIMKIADASGLRIERRIGYGLLTEKVARLMPCVMALKVERLLSTIPGLKHFGINQLYIARLKD